MTSTCKRFAAPTLLLAVVSLACSGSTAGSRPQAAGPGAQEPAQRRTITVALTAEISSLVTELGVVGRQALPTRYVHEFVNGYLTARSSRRRSIPAWRPVAS